MNQKKVLFHLFLFLSISVFAQQNITIAQPNGCGSDNYLQILRKDAAFSANELNMNKQIRLFNA